MTIQDRIQELVSDETLESGIFEATSPDELMKVFAQYKIELDEINKEEAFESIQKIKSGELVDEELDAVSGGGIGFTLLMHASPYIPGGPILLAGVAVVALATYAYRKYKKR